MTITFQVEDSKNYKDGANWLWDLHYEEIAHNKSAIPLDIDFERYQQLADLGILYIVTIRDEDKIVGYFIANVMTHIRYKKSLTAFTDIYYLHPDYRQSWIGIKLFKFVEEDLKKKGVERLIATTKVKLDNSPIFERLKWVFTEKLYTKLIK